jgi:adenine phosphoribosyltransferase
VSARSSLGDRVAARLRDIPDFPKPGILFKDITPVLLDPALFRDAIAYMGDAWGPIDRIVGMESRGFIFGAALVDRLSAGLVLARKKGKLPFATFAVEYGLEYGSETLEVHTDAIRRGDRVLVVDDLLATGGTAHATIGLVRKAGGVVVGASFLVELGFLDGRARIDVPVRSLLTVG